jgi:hypothetical protein
MAGNLTIAYRIQRLRANLESSKTSQKCGALLRVIIVEAEMTHSIGCSAIAQGRPGHEVFRTVRSEGEHSVDGELRKAQLSCECALRHGAALVREARESMKKHSYKVGPPFRVPDAPTRNVTFRLAEGELEALDAHVEIQERSRSELVRYALDKCGFLTQPTKKRER